MIRVIRIFSLAVFAAALLLYGGVSYYTKSRSDSQGPVISMEEKEITVSVRSSQEEMLEGIRASDAKDGDVTDSLVVERMGIFSQKGRRLITVAAFDSDRNVTKTSRTILYDDYTSPRLQLNGPLRAAVNSVNSLMDNIHAVDCIDGDITENVQITQDKGTVNTSQPGEYRVKITVSNSVGDVVQLPVTIELYDYSSENTRPGILLTDYLIYLAPGSSFDPTDYLKGVRIRSKDYLFSSSTQELPVSRDQIQITNPVDTDTPGTYEVIYSAEDGDGNRGTVRLIVVITED